jgi:hypothetical protein
MNRETSTGIVVITIGIMTILSVVNNNFNSDRVIDEVRNNKCIDLERQIEAITAKKNTLYLIALERGKKRPNRALLDSLEIDYELR